MLYEDHFADVSKMVSTQKWNSASFSTVTGVGGNVVLVKLTALLEPAVVKLIVAKTIEVTNIFENILTFLPVRLRDSR